MKFTSDVVVLSARRYSMTDEKTGELVQGTKVQYIEDWNDCMEQNKRGVSVLSANFPFKWFDDLTDLPATYEADFQLAEGARGKPVVRMTALRFKAPIIPGKDGK